MSDPRYDYPHTAPYTYPNNLQSENYLYPAPSASPAQGYYQGPLVMAPPPQCAAPPPRRESWFLDACLAAFCCCCRVAMCCYDPSSISDCC